MDEHPKIDVMTLPVHPLADILPLVSGEELAAINASVKAHGVLVPLKVGMYEGKPTLYDGRNRRIAAKKAGIKPAYEWLNGVDAAQYIAAINFDLRSLTTGQKAAVLVTMYPPGDNNKKDEARVRAPGHGIPGDTITRARTVQRVLPEVLKEVIRSKTLLQHAYDNAIATEKAQKDATKEQAQLKKKAPDLHAQVASGKKTLTQAINESNRRARAAAKKEAEEKRKKASPEEQAKQAEKQAAYDKGKREEMARIGICRDIDRVLDACQGIGHKDEKIADMLALFDPKDRKDYDRVFSAESIKERVKYLNAKAVKKIIAVIRGVGKIYD